MLSRPLVSQEIKLQLSDASDCRLKLDNFFVQFVQADFLEWTDLLQQVSAVAVAEVSAVETKSLLTA